jgi:hypothetical protein
MTWDASPPAFGQRLPVVDLGCGDGRQTAFWPATSTPLSASTSPPPRSSVPRPQRTPANVTYRVVDARDPDAASALRDRIGDANVYIRGVLHARPPDARRLAVETLARLLGNADTLFIKELSPETRSCFASITERYGPPTGLTRVMQFAGPAGEISESELARLFPPHHFQCSAQEPLTSAPSKLPSGERIAIPALYLSAKAELTSAPATRREAAGVRPTHPSCDIGSDAVSRCSRAVSLHKDHDGNLPDSASGRSSGVDRNATPLLRCDVMQGLGERPAMSGGIANGALTLSVRKIAWLADDLAAMLADAVAQGGDVINPEHHRRGLLAGRG